MSGKPPKKHPVRARQRLARISHHFLSDPPVTEAQTSSNTTTPSHVLVIADKETLPFPSAALAIQLAQLGINCELHHPTRSVVCIQPRESKSAPPASPIKIKLKSCYNADSIENTTTYTLLLPTQATPQGLRHSFMQLKHYMHRGTLENIGITITGADKPRLAALYFAALYQACQRFLSQDVCRKISSYGLLSHRTAIENSLALNGIAQLIVDDYLALDHQQRVNTVVAPPPSTPKNTGGIL